MSVLPLQRPGVRGGGAQFPTTRSPEGPALGLSTCVTACTIAGLAQLGTRRCRPALVRGASEPSCPGYCPKRLGPKI
jgi:hypothetical protein